MIAILCASTGGNLKVSNQTKEILDDLGQKSEVIILENFKLPLYTSNTEAEIGVPNSALDLTNKLKKATALIIVGPEYNGSMAPVLNNALAWVSRADEDWRVAFNGKFSIVMSHSGGGGQKVILAMKQQLEHLGCNTFARTFVANSNKDINEKALRNSLVKLCKLAEL